MNKGILNLLIAIRNCVQTVARLMVPWQMRLKKGEGIDYSSLAYGNIPTRHTDLFHKSLDFLEQYKDYDAAVSMQNVGKYHPDWMYEYNNEILQKKKEEPYRRQMLPQKMHSDGHTFIF